MESKDLKPKKGSVSTESIKDKPVLQIRPDESDESITTPPDEDEIKDAVAEINPDENSMDSRG